MLSEHERYHGLGMDTNVLMVWEWMHLLSYALGTRTLLWLGHGCAIVCSRNTNVIMVWEWMRDSMLSEHERYYGVGMDALVIVCSQNTNVIMVWASMLWHSRSLFLEKHDAWYTQYFGPPKHFECVVRATQATSGEVGQVCIFCAFTLRRSQNQ